MCLPRTYSSSHIHCTLFTVFSTQIPTRWIIGKQGSYINQMIKKSGASITISESTSQEFGRVWRYVHIKGGGRAVDRAKKLLHIRLERLEPREANVEDAILSEEDEGAIASSHGVSDDGYVNQNPTEVEY